MYVHNFARQVEQCRQCLIEFRRIIIKYRFKYLFSIYLKTIAKPNIQSQMHIYILVIEPGTVLLYFIWRYRKTTKMNSDTKFDPEITGIVFVLGVDSVIQRQLNIEQ